MDEGAANPVSFSNIPITKETVWTISYTSGTTGDPKGAMINHENIISEMSIFKFFDGF